MPSAGDSTTGPSGEPEEPGEPMDDDADGELDEEAPESELEEDDPVVDDIKEWVEQQTNEFLLVLYIVLLLFLDLSIHLPSLYTLPEGARATFQWSRTNRPVILDISL